MNFNSHAHVERDDLNSNDTVDTFISTHTLTWSVTVSRIIIYTDKGNFNSHAHVERDVPTPDYFDLDNHFNSHAHVERDDPPPEPEAALAGFQLTRSRGA